MTVSQIGLSAHYSSKQRAREALAVDGYAINRAQIDRIGVQPRDFRFSDIFKAMTRRDLSFAEAFSGMCYVLNATNAEFHRQRNALFGPEAFADVNGMNFAIVGREFLSCMAIKEAKSCITPEEVAGMVSAAMLDLIVRPYFGPMMVETSGTGGDIGFPPEESPRKTINLSTLSSLVVAALGLPVMKHGSYANTSAVGSSDAIERLGASIEQGTVAEMQRLFVEHSYIFTDAHVVKTIHDLSHLEPRHETINHILGPMTPPISADTRLMKIMGVNEKVHPQTIAKAYAEVHRVGAQTVGNVAIVTGLDAVIDRHHVLNEGRVRDHVILDELSPYASVVAFVRNGEYVGSYLLRPDDFGVRLDAEMVALENRSEVLENANLAVLAGQNESLVDYLSMNAGLVLYTAEYLHEPGAIDAFTGPNRDVLQLCMNRCRAAIRHGDPRRLLDAYVASTRQLV